MQAIVIGAGLVGSLLSIYLKKQGHSVTVYERRQDMRTSEGYAGRSINLAMSNRGLKGLAGVGLQSEIEKICLPMHGRMVHSPLGDTNYQPYGKPGQFINSVSRGELNKILMNEAEKQGVEFVFNARCQKLNLDQAEVIFETPIGLLEAKGDRVFGTDGAFSAARLQLQLTTDRFNYTQNYIEHGYKELSIPPIDGDFAMDPNALHIWPRGGYMLIALPNTDKSFTCTLFFPFEGEESFAALDNATKARAFFERVFPDALKLMPHFDEEYSQNPVSSLVTVKCLPWHYKDKLLLLGDAAHAIVPFYGQGMNCGFEDCSVLGTLLNTMGDNWEGIFTEFEKQRKPNGDAVAELALLNFIEMRDKVADPMFILRKKIESKFNSLYPTLWLPLYSMVTFSDIPYSDALRIGQWQNTIMDIVMDTPDIETLWDNDVIMRLMLSEIEKNPYEK